MDRVNLEIVGTVRADFGLPHSYEQCLCAETFKKKGVHDAAPDSMYQHASRVQPTYGTKGSLHVFSRKKLILRKKNVVNDVTTCALILSH